MVVTVGTLKAWNRDWWLSWLVFYPLIWICVISVSEYEVYDWHLRPYFYWFDNHQKTWRMSWRLLFFLVYVGLVLRGSNIVERILDCWELLILVLSFNLPRLKFLTYKIRFILFWIMMRLKPRWERLLSFWHTARFAEVCWVAR